MILEDRTIWFTSPETTPRDTAPSEALARFVGNNYRPPAVFLDIGSGSGANIRYLEGLGFTALGVDSAPEAYADWYQPIHEFLAICGPIWDCIYDINTLCHVENPPYAAIYKALRPGGKFFSIHPADDTGVDMTGKGFTRLATFRDLLKLVRVGWDYNIHKSLNWSGNTKITAWQIEAAK